jgi:hypothetical protein
VRDRTVACAGVYQSRAVVSAVPSGIRCASLGKCAEDSARYSSEIFTKDCGEVRTG